MSNVCTRMPLIYHTCVAPMYPYVICMLLVCARILSVCTLTSSVCQSYVLVCHLYVTHMYSHVIRTSLVCGFTVNLYCMQMLSFKRHNTDLVQMEILNDFQLLIYFLLS